VRQTLQFAETGNVDVAIVALSLSVQSKGHWKLIPQELHKPIDQALAVIKKTKLEQDAKHSRFAQFNFEKQELSKNANQKCKINLFLASRYPKIKFLAQHNLKNLIC
jgi:ABC-type molybdate transport system substrate-binding protein